MNRVLQRPGCTPEEICTELARHFRVRYDEVALLQVVGGYLRFLCPAQLRGGSIPLTSSAVAAKTARNRHPEFFNDFVNVQHFSVFEVMASSQVQKADNNEHVIQKLMTAPILDGNDKVWGVVQISRKGTSCATAGPDFTFADLEELTRAAAAVGRRMTETRPL
ncbi:MAG: GAF domain-containing protein [Terriglobales bacterium]